MWLSSLRSLNKCPPSHHPSVPPPYPAFSPSKIDTLRDHSFLKRLYSFAPRLRNALNGQNAEETQETLKRWRRSWLYPRTLLPYAQATVIPIYNTKLPSALFIGTFGRLRPTGACTSARSDTEDFSQRLKDTLPPVFPQPQEVLQQAFKSYHSHRQQ
ncbi:hypothetical protein BC827DRAFT_549970 [Russula dissimulans]|nr:hypothetical protein BC827DRAFT_549970 [Russula dissimulans]